jgi:hypothetical protein
LSFGTGASLRFIRKPLSSLVISASSRSAAARRRSSPQYAATTQHTSTSSNSNKSENCRPPDLGFEIASDFGARSAFTDTTLGN